MPIAESANAPNRIRHMTRQQHEEAAQLLRQAMDDLAAVTSVVQQRHFTDDVLHILRFIRQRLVAPLSAGLGAPFSAADNPYQDEAP
jgi:hypothetical protein